MMDLRKEIKKLPYAIQQPFRYLYGAIPFSYRSGKAFRNKYKLLQDSQWWSREKHQQYQMNQLEKLLNHAYLYVPYYKRIFDERGLKPKNIQSFEDLKQLPFLTKDIIRNNMQDLIAQNYQKSKLEYATTGGSTGIPLEMYHDKRLRHANEWAFMLTQWKRVGYKMGDRCVVLRGNVLAADSREQYWQYNPVYKYLVMSSYHISDETWPLYVDKIREFKPAFIQAYPSVISILARFMRENNISHFPTIKAILCGSENLYPSQRKILEEVFRCRVYSWYGHTELAVLAGECEKNTNYHIFSEYGIVELVDKNSEPLTCEDDDMGEIIATGFNNYVMPFIRYRTTDLAVPSIVKCECGRNYPLLKKIEGRLQELIVTKDKRFITLTALIFAQHFEAFSKVKTMQLVQEKEGEIIVNIVKNSTYSYEDEKEILKKMQLAVGRDSLQISFNYIDEIQRSKSGKHLFLIQKLPLQSWRTLL